MAAKESSRCVVHSPGASAIPPAGSDVDSYGVRATNVALDVLTLAATVAATPKGTVFSGIRLIRAAVAGRFAEQLRAEWAAFVEAGKIKPDYAETDQARTIFGDTLESLEDANIDDEQLDLLRRLFMAAASETVSDRNDVLVREYLEVGRTLATGEIRVLAAYYRYLPEWAELRSSAGSQGPYGINEAMAVLQKNSGLTHSALIERHERSLIEKGLVRPNGPGSGYAQADQKLHRLTDFGFAFCEFLKGYDRM
jgi:hypothetical protein